MDSQPLRPNSESLMELIRSVGINDALILEAFRVVPRHFFLEPESFVVAYQDESVAIRSKAGVFLSCSTQPSLMARMLQALRLSSGMSVLEIGTGSGYNAALISRLVGEAGRVVSVEVNPEVAERARRALKKAAPNVSVVTANAFVEPKGLGFFDRIIATAGSAFVPLPWVSALSPEGRICIPLRVREEIDVQVVVAFERTAESLLSDQVITGSFIPLLSFGDESPAGESWAKGMVGGESVLLRGHYLSDPAADPPSSANIHRFREWLPVEEILPFAALCLDEGLVEVYREGDATSSVGITRRDSSAFFRLDGFHVVGVQGYGAAFDALREATRQWSGNGKPRISTMDVSVQFDLRSRSQAITFRLGTSTFSRSVGGTR